MDEHLIPIDTRTILRLLDAQRKTHDALYDLVTLMNESRKGAPPKPVAKMTVKR